MGFRFRKRIKLFPGLWLMANISKKGVRETVGLPGTGISYQSKRVGIKPPRGPARGRRQSVNVGGAFLAFIAITVIVLWILAHLH